LLFKPEEIKRNF